MNPQQCPRCKVLNTHDARFCKSCSFVLDIRTTKELDDITKTASETFALLKNSPDLLRLIAEALTKAGTAKI